MRIAKYVGCVVDIIYEDRAGKLSKRRIKVQAISGSFIRAHCMAANAPRVFRMEGILAVDPVKHRVG
ncbi:hypothetical protein [Paenibacillus sp. OV219]|uniref:hypothetical protein n=1 Tax=Paenibacillus sp. OV219 TaxID=1884377 RepID=UPI0008B965E2|nr:hypothetical protein [Paenibacillus sp. OV219]SEM66186.1 hypothetical protein SAMN05518847_101455 [Paenibacillus sp. OV219]